MNHKKGIDLFALTFLYGLESARRLLSLRGLSTEQNGGSFDRRRHRRGGQLEIISDKVFGRQTAPAVGVWSFHGRRRLSAGRRVAGRYAAHQVRPLHVARLEKGEIMRSVIGVKR